MARKNNAQKTVANLKPWQKVAGTKEIKHITLHKSFFEQELWWSLKSRSRDVYEIMLFKYNGSNDDNLEFPYNAVEKIMSAPTFYNCIKDLIKHGYIEYVSHNKHNRKTNVYKFSARWREQAGKKITF